MGTTCLDSPLPLLHDLKVTIHETSMVFPSKKTEKKCLFLSNIDKVLNFDMETVHFFLANKDFPPQKVVERFKNALEDALVLSFRVVEYCCISYRFFWGGYNVV
ncbi:omega-hydroxypalmitate O-feruloyl transferase [Spatholobus suberectus]|nr:omega-hydroxypalmitate O-feruloyl transferase [Spatholobus suberectus]